MGGGEGDIKLLQGLFDFNPLFFEKRKKSRQFVSSYLLCFLFFLPCLSVCFFFSFLFFVVLASFVFIFIHRAFIPLQTALDRVMMSCSVGLMVLVVNLVILLMEWPVTFLSALNKCALPTSRTLLPRPCLKPKSSQYRRFGS